MWKLITEIGMPPTRLVRYCCSVLKEHGGEGRFITTGVRWAESMARKNRAVLETFGKRKTRILLNDNDDRQMFETCQLKAKRICNPIIDWTDEDVWNFLKDQGIEGNPLYQCGFHRVGCVGCPMARRHGRMIEFAMWPKYRNLYIHAFDRMIERRKEKGLKTDWKTGYECFLWWMEDKNIVGQEKLEGF